MYSSHARELLFFVKSVLKWCTIVKPEQHRGVEDNLEAWCTELDALVCEGEQRQE